MTTEDFIIDLFCRIDDHMQNVPNHNQAALAHSEMVTQEMLIAIKGVGQRAFYCWLIRDYADWFPLCPYSFIPSPENALGMGTDVFGKAQSTGYH